jgi:hypothetical protein
MIQCFEILEREKIRRHRAECLPLVCGHTENANDLWLSGDTAIIVCNSAKSCTQV